MRSRSTAVTFVLAIAGLLLAMVVLWLLLGLVVRMFGWAIGLFPVIFAAVGIYSCVTSPRQKTNVKLLWILVIVLAPILGTLLWFFWGKHNT